MKEALIQSEKENIHSLIPRVFGSLTWLELKRDNVKAAREYNDRRVELEKSLNLPYKDDEFLLVKEARYDEAIAQAENDISSEGEEKLDKGKEITAHIVLAQAWLGKGEKKKGKDYLASARKLMEETGCWRERDRLEETEV